jgi:hypothetical protein
MDPIRPAPSLSSGSARYQWISIPGPGVVGLSGFHRRKRLCDCQAALRRTPGKLGARALMICVLPLLWAGRDWIGQQVQGACRPAPGSREVQIRSTRLFSERSPSARTSKGFLLQFPAFSAVSNAVQLFNGSARVFLAHRRKSLSQQILS